MMGDPVRFLFLDYFDRGVDTRVLTVLLKVPGHLEWTALEGGTRPYTPGEVLPPLPKNVIGRLEARRLSMADAEELAFDADAYWERATQQPD